MKYIIEHLEPKLYKWCFIEYRHISRIAGKKNLIFTNLNKNQAEKLKNYGKCFTKKVSELNLKNICVLDPEAKKTFAPKDAKRFDCLVFGGILGDYPPRKRTKAELKLKGERRNIGKEQFPTDNAVAVCKNIVNGIPLGKMKFVDFIELDLRKGESVQFPFRYLLVNGKPLISGELVEFLKKRKGF